jgi:hypothetical protein
VHALRVVVVDVQQVGARVARREAQARTVAILAGVCKREPQRSAQRPRDGGVVEGEALLAARVEPQRGAGEGVRGDSCWGAVHESAAPPREVESQCELRRLVVERQLRARAGQDRERER